MEIIPRTLDFTASAAYGALGRFTTGPFPDATLRQDGSIQLLPITALQAGFVWHTTPALDLYAYAGLERPERHFRLSEPYRSATAIRSTTTAAAISRT